MGSTADIKEVQKVWDNRENRRNVDYHKPSFSVEFKGHTKESPNFIKINCTGEDAERFEQYGLWLMKNGKSKKFLFVIETGTYEGKDWSAIREVKTLEGVDILEGQPLLEEDGGVDHKTPAAPPKSDAPPATKVAAPPAVTTAKAPAQDVKVGWVTGVCTPESPTFWSEKSQAESLRITRGAAFNAAVAFLAATGQFAQFDKDGFCQIQHPEVANAVKALSNTLAGVLREQHASDRMDHYLAMLDRCVNTEEGRKLVEKAHREMPLDQATIFQKIAHDSFKKKKEAANGEG